MRPKTSRPSPIFLAFALLAGCSTFMVPEYEGPNTDHYDGKQFFNSGDYRDKSFASALQWWSQREPKPWPSQIDVSLAAPPPAEVDATIRLTFVNHATVLIQHRNANILTDPVWSDRIGPYSWLGPKRHHVPGVRFEDLPRIHASVISHNHYDHLDIPTLLRLREKGTPFVIAGLGNKAFFAKNEIPEGIDLDWWQSHRVSEQIQVFAVPARHWSFRSWGNRRQTLWAGFVIRSPEKSIFFAGDTGFGTHFQEIRDRLGPMDVCLLPIGAYEPRDFMKDNHINPAEAVQAHKILECKTSLAVHYGTFQQSDEAYGQPELDLQKALHESNVSSERFLILKPGQSQDIM